MAGRRLRVGVLFGGRSSEHEVSLQSARAVMDALAQDGHEVVPIGISKTGRFLVGGDPLRALSSGDFTGEQSATMLPEPGGAGLVHVVNGLPAPSAAGVVSMVDGEPAPCGTGTVPAVDALPASGATGQVPVVDDQSPLTLTDVSSPQASGASLDVLFPVLHGTFGEDGTVQGLFELAAVPYVGAGVLGSALGMDKVVQKTLWRGMGLPVVDFLSVLRRELEYDTDALLDRIEHAFGYPCFTKPANLGSSVGVRKARDRGELMAGLEEAARYDAKLLVERAVDARELECGVLGNDDPIASVVGEIVPGADFYDYRAKYLDAGSQAVIPAEIEPALADEVRRLAVAAFKAVDAAGLARVDFFLDRTSGHLYLNEINTMPGFTEISMYPKLWAASGVPFPELVTRIAELAIARFQDRSRNQTTLRLE